MDNDGRACPGDHVHLTSKGVSSEIYNWSGPNRFSSNAQNPTIFCAAAAYAGDSY